VSIHIVQDVASEVSVPSQNVDPESIQLALTRISGQSIAFKYQFLPPGQPVTNHYTIYIWQANSAYVPYSGKIIKQANFQTDDQAGSVNINGLSLGGQSYCIGIAVGDRPVDVCAALWASPNEVNPPTPATQSTNFVLSSADSGQVDVVLNTLMSYHGATNGGVCRLMDGTMAQTTPVTTYGGDQTIGTDGPTNHITFTGLSLAVGNSYVVGFYTNPGATKWASLACSISFTIID